MLTLLSEARFWSFRDDINIKDTDFGAYRYQEKKDYSDSLYYEGKKDYSEKRGITWAPNNKRPLKLKDCVRELEEQLNQHKVVYCQWRDHCVLQMMFSSGLFVHICINIFTGDVIKMSFDKYLIGKLISECISNVICTRTHIICTYNDNQISLVHFTKPSIKRNAPEKMSHMDPKIQIVDIAGPSGRRLERSMTINTSGDMIIIWWRCSQDEVYPWAPSVKDHDRANVHVYSICGTKMDLICYYRTEQDPICVTFSQILQNIIRTIEQKVSRKGDVTVENCTYEISKGKMQRTAVTSIPLQTQVCCHGFSPDDEKLLLGCIDGSVVLFDEGRGITHLVKAAFIPTMISWHLDGAVVMIANERSLFQFFDISLSCIKNQIISEDMTPSNLLDLATYFSFQPTLLKMCWSKKCEVSMYPEQYAQTDCFLLLLFEHGPIATLRLFGGNGMTGDFHNSGLTADVLVYKYLTLNQVDRAINLLLSLNWDTYGSMCLTSLHKIVNYLFKQSLNAEREVQLQTALASFHVPLRPISYETEVEFGDQVKDLTRRFFHHLLRHDSFDKAFCLAIDINDYDLFMDIYFCAKDLGDEEMANAAKTKAEELYNRSGSRGSDHSTCSNSSCSICSDQSTTNSECSCNSESCLEHETKYSTSSKPANIPPPLPNPSYTKYTQIPASSSPIPTYTPPLPFTKLSMDPNYNLRDRINDPPLPDLNVNSSHRIYPPPQTDYLYAKPFNLPQTTFNSRYSESFTKYGTGSVQNLCKPQLSSSSDLLYSIKTNKPPIALPRTLPKHHVIDIIPKPILNRAQSIQSVYQSHNTIDQTLGIPLSPQNLNYPPKTYPKKPKSESLLNVNAPLYHQYPLVSGQIPRQSILMNLSSKVSNPQIKSVPRIPPPPSITNAMSLLNLTQEPSGAACNLSNSVQNLSTNQNIQHAVSKPPGEKNKVKFSDTVTVTVVPEIPRKEKTALVGDRQRRGGTFYHMDPKQELADSLPLCHPNEDYLKDFTPIQESEDDDNRATIKVVHFGVV